MAGPVWSLEDDEFILAHPELTPTELQQQLEDRHGPNPGTYQQRRSRLTRYGIDSFHKAGEGALSDEDRLGRIADLLAKSGIAVEDIGAIEKVRLNEWEGFYKDADGEAHKVEMSAASLILTPAWESGPEWPVVQPAQLSPVHPIRSTATPIGRESLVAVVVTDLQIGYFRDSIGTLQPTHDERAISIMLQVVLDSQPDRVVFLGDSLDLSEMSRYRKEPAWAQTTQAQLDRMVRLIQQVKEVAPPDCSFDWIEGNHEVRMSNWVKDNAAAAFGLRPGAAPHRWPVLSVPTLCRLDELSVNYHSGYPAVKLWLNDRVKITHGDKSGDSAVTKMLDEERASTICGHMHKRIWREKTRETRYGPRTIMVASPGCMCRIDGAVPSTRSGTDLEGMPVERYEDWQQGFAVVTYDATDGPFAYEPIAIHDQWAFWRGRKYKATCNLMGEELRKGQKNAA